MADPITIGYISDWPARLRTRLYTQFRDKATWLLWIDEVLGPQLQDLEDSLQSLAGLLDIDNSVGVQLDNIGRIVGQLRFGLDDATYRIYLKARIRANLSTGTPEDLYSVFLALLGAGASMVYRPGRNKNFYLEINTPITDAQAEAGLSFLRAAKEAAARAILEWQEFEDDLMFVFACGSQLTVASNISDGTLAVVDTSMFPQPGEFEAAIDLGFGAEDLLTLQVAGPTTLLVVDPGELTATHEKGARVEATGLAGGGFAVGTQFAGDQLAGSSTIIEFFSFDIFGWPSSGSVLINAGHATQETKPYTIIASHIHCNTPLAFNHSRGETVALVGNYGGNMAGAIEA